MFGDVNILLATHAQLADYFLGVWGGGVLKPFEYTNEQRQRFRLDSTRGECDRKVNRTKVRIDCLSVCIFQICVTMSSTSSKLAIVEFLLSLKYSTVKKTRS